MTVMLCILAVEWTNTKILKWIPLEETRRSHIIGLHV